MKEKIEAAFKHFFGWTPPTSPDDPVRKFLDEVIKIVEGKDET